jgi:hypothetical protein
MESVAVPAVGLFRWSDDQFRQWLEQSGKLGQFNAVGCGVPLVLNLFSGAAAGERSLDCP